MTALSRTGLRETCKAGLPGLLHFGNRAPWRIDVGADVRTIRLHLPEAGILSINAMRVEGATAPRLPPHRARMSSSTIPDAAPERLLAGQAIHTERQDLPWWQVEFETPHRIEALTVVNRGDMFAARAYGLCVEWERADGVRLGVDNLSPALLRERLARHRDGLDAAHAKTPIATEAAVQLRQHLSRVAVAIDESNAAPRELAGARAATLDAIAALLSVAEQDGLRALAGFAPTLDALVWRGPDAPLAPCPAEASIAAFCVAANVVAQGTADLKRITELQRLVPNHDALVGLEAEIDGFVRRMEGAPSAQPVRILPHGIRRSDWAAAEQAYVDSVREVIALMAGIGHACALGYGTLLGAVREGRLIPHDDDVDILAEMRARDLDGLDAELAGIVARLRAAGIQASITPGFRFLKIIAPRAKRLVDVFPVLAPAAGTVRLYLRNMHFADMPRDAMLPFDSIAFYGAPIPVPRDPAAFLERHFGRTWRIPNRFSRFPWIAPPVGTS